MHYATDIGCIQAGEPSQQSGQKLDKWVAQIANEAELETVWTW